MTTALDISRQFNEEVVLPLVRRHHGGLVDDIAVGVAGTGSDVLNLDDEISRDHHWGPRAVILLPDDLAGRHAEPIRRTLLAHAPKTYQGYPVHHDRANRTAVCVDGIHSYFKWFLGTEELPSCAEDWFALCETDLLHVTAGEVFHDPSGQWSAIRRKLAFYPDRVWRKRIADWCMYVTGRDAPYNLHRVSRRGDDVASALYFGQTLRRVMELVFAIERRYSPYPKWQHRVLCTLDGCGPTVVALLDEVMSTTDWRARVDGLIRINHVCAHRLHEIGMTGPPEIKPFDDGLTDLTLYGSAREIYAGLPEAWREMSFNQIDSWEKMARLVLFDSGDYFVEKFGSDDAS